MAIDRGHTTELTDSVMVGMINYWSWKPRVSKTLQPHSQTIPGLIPRPFCRIKSLKLRLVVPSQSCDSHVMSHAIKLQQLTSFLSLRSLVSMDHRRQKGQESPSERIKYQNSELWGLQYYCLIHTSLVPRPSVWHRGSGNETRSVPHYSRSLAGSYSSASSPKSL